GRSLEKVGEPANYPKRAGANREREKKVSSSRSFSARRSGHLGPAGTVVARGFGSSRRGCIGSGPLCRWDGHRPGGGRWFWVLGRWVVPRWWSSGMGRFP